MAIKTTRRVPGLRLHKASGQAVCTLNGKDHYLGRFGSLESRAEYDRLIAGWLANGRQIESGADLTIAELYRDYLTFATTYYRKGGKPTSEIGTIRQSMRVLMDLYGDTLASEFRPSFLETVRN